MQSPLSGETIKRPVAQAAPVVDLSPLLDRCKELEKRLAEVETRERSSIAELTGYAMKAMEAAMKACSIQPAPTPASPAPPDPRINEITEAVADLKSKIEGIATTVNKPLPAMKTPAIDMEAITQAIRREIANVTPAVAAAQSWDEVTVVIGSRDANGNIKEFVVKPKGAKT